jgi:hypothetical protein
MDRGQGGGQPMGEPRQRFPPQWPALADGVLQSTISAT